IGYSNSVRSFRSISLKSRLANRYPERYCPISQRIERIDGTKIQIALRKVKRLAMRSDQVVPSAPTFSVQTSELILLVIQSSSDNRSAFFAIRVLHRRVGGLALSLAWGHQRGFKARQTTSKMCGGIPASLYGIEALYWEGEKPILMNFSQNLRRASGWLASVKFGSPPHPIRQS